MKVAIQGIPDTADISALIRNIDSALVKSGISPVDCSPTYTLDSKQDEKPLRVQAAEILEHICNRDYGLAESKAGLLRDQLRKGDWTLGSEKIEEPPADISVSLDMATEFYLGMYRAIADQAHTYGTCWLKHISGDISGAWIISIDTLHLRVGDDAIPQFELRGPTCFRTKEDALKKFTEWTRQHTAREANHD